MFISDDYINLMIIFSIYNFEFIQILNIYCNLFFVKNNLLNIPNYFIV